MQMGSLSIATVIFVLALLNFAGALIMAAYLPVAGERRLLLVYTLNKLVHAFSWFLRFLDTVSADPFLRTLANILLVAGFMIEAGVFVAITRRWRLRFVIAGALVALAVSAAVLWPREQTMDQALLAVAILSTAFLWLTAIILISQRPWSAFRLTLSVAFLVLPVLLVVSFIQSGSDMFLLYLSPGPWSMTLFVAGFMLQMFLIFGVVLVAKEKDEARLRVLADTDSLTGIANRRAFFSAVQKQMESHTRAGGEVSVVLMDLDSFKAVNDTWGHETGDRVIQHFCSVVQSSIRDGDIFARFGGEEFALYLPKASRIEAELVARRIHERLHGSHGRKDDSLPRYTVSLGICTGTLRTQGDLDQMLSQSDRALYYSKNHGKDCSSWTRSGEESFEVVA